MPDCGAPLATDQRYCLNCGARRGDAAASVPSKSSSGSAARRTDRAPAPGRTTRAARLDAGHGARGARHPRDRARARRPDRARPARTATRPQVVSLGEGGARPPALGGGEAVEARSGARRARPGRRARRAGRSSSARCRRTRSAAGGPGRARRRRGEGREGRRALDSDEYESLPGGSYIVYSGVYDDKGAATKALKGLQKDFPDAQVIEVSQAKPKGEKVDIGHAETLDTEGAAGARRPERRRVRQEVAQAPGRNGDPGDAPPKDNKAPGGGSDPTVIE